MTTWTTLQAFEDESVVLTSVLASLDEAEFARPTNCPPWTVKDLVVHLAQALPAPESVDKPVTLHEPADYYRRKVRFEPGFHERIADSAVTRAATMPTGASAVEFFDNRWRDRLTGWQNADPSSIIETSHGVAALDTYIVTRLLSNAAHGLDLAISLERSPWTTPSALAVLRPVFISLLGDDPDLDSATLFALGTGRQASIDERFPLLS